MQSFYANPRDSLDARLSPEFGRDVVRTCVEIGRQMAAPPMAWPTLGYQRRSTRGQRRSTVGRARPEILVLGVTGFIGQELARQFLDGDISFGYWSATLAGCPPI